MRYAAMVMVVAVVAGLARSFASHGSPRPTLDRPVEPAAPDRLRFASPVRAIFHDARGRYWFGSAQEGVACVDGDVLTYFTKEDGLADGQIRAIQEDSHGTIWFQTARGISRFDADGMARYDPPMDEPEATWRIGPDDLWFLGHDPIGLARPETPPWVYGFDGDTFRAHRLPAPREPSVRDDNLVTAITRGPSGTLWIATYAAVFGFDGTTTTIIDDASLGLGEATGRLHVRCLHEDRRGRLWIGNNGIGVIVKDGDSILNFTQDRGVGRWKRGSPGSLALRPGDAPAGEPSLHRVFSIGEDRDGGIWFGTIEQGAWRFDGTTLRQFGAADGLTTESVMSIHADRNGDLWLGGIGVFRFDGAAFERVR